MCLIIPLLTSLTEGEKGEYEDLLAYDIEAYYDLVSDGGRPLFPLELFMEVSENVNKYREIMNLRTWRHSHYYLAKEKEEAKWDWRRFLTQLRRWEEFRRVQRYVRKYRAESVEMFFVVASHLLRTWEGSVISDDYDNEYLKPEEMGFPEYTEEMRKRLASHGFTQTFRLDDDPARQDKLTTWIEYLNFEYSWFDWYDVKRSQR
jgi:hypothetical protein